MNGLVYDDGFMKSIRPRGKPGSYCGIISNICFDDAAEFVTLRLFIEKTYPKISIISTKPGELKQELKSENSFRGTFSELVCFHLLDKIGVKDIKHSPLHKGHTPDFEFSEGKNCFLLEVLSKGEPEVFRNQPIINGAKAGFVPSTEKRLREKLIKKFDKYRNLEFPIITCLFSDTLSLLPMRVKHCEWMLYGPEIQVIGGNLYRNRRTMYFPNGEKARGGGLFNQNDVEYIGNCASGHIDIFHDLGNGRFEITVFRNPYAEKQIPDSIYKKFDSYYEENEIVLKEDGEYILTYRGIEKKSGNLISGESLI